MRTLVLAATALFCASCIATGSLEDRLMAEVADLEAGLIAAEDEFARADTFEEFKENSKAALVEFKEEAVAEAKEKAIDLTELLAGLAGTGLASAFGLNTLRNATRKKALAAVASQPPPAA
jgi:hypothetical protein